MFESLKEFISYRGMIRNLVKREIRGRYKGSVLGFLWNFIVPLVQILVYILVFSNIFKSGLDNYAVFLTSGMIVWIMFSESLVDGSGMLVGNSEMLKKIYFPRSVLPISMVLSKLVNFFIMLAIFFIFIAVMDFGASWQALLCLFIAIPIFLLFLIGLTLFLSSINVYLRDIQYIVSVIMIALIWLTPIMYVRDQFDNALLNTLLTINPMTYFIEMFQSILYWQTVPSLSSVCICLGIALISLFVGILVFKLLEKDFAEVL